MAEISSPGSPEVHLNGHDTERRKSPVVLSPDDLARIAKIRGVVHDHVDEFVTVFFDYLSHIDDATLLFKKRNVLSETKHLKREHLIAMVDGDYGKAYADQQWRLGMLYSKVYIDARVFLGAFQHLMRYIGAEIIKHYSREPQEAFESFMSLQKVGVLDIGVIVDVMLSERERTIILQQEAIRELSTPVLQLRDRLLVLPLIGVIDSLRGKQITETLLHAIRTNRAKVVVIDITGVAAVDSQIANRLMQTAAASNLMGAKVIITGISADVAQAMVNLGIDLSMLTTVNDLQSGLEDAERWLGYKVVPPGNDFAPHTGPA